MQEDGNQSMTLKYIKRAITMRRGGEGSGAVQTRRGEAVEALHN